MKFGRQIRENKELREGIRVYTSEYFEMTYLKFGISLNMVFMAPDMQKARIKAKSVLRNHNGSKVLKIRKLDSKRLGPDITWNRSGSPHSRYQSKRRKKGQ
jgi:hypothetical protein